MKRRAAPEEDFDDAPLFAQPKPGQVFKYTKPESFGGETFDEARDGSRLRRQLSRVLALMIDGKPRTLGAISTETGYPEASVSARLRDLRKDQFGGYKVERQYVDRGVWSYRVTT